MDRNGNNSDNNDNIDNINNNTNYSMNSSQTAKDDQEYIDELNKREYLEFKELRHSKKEEKQRSYPSYVLVGLASAVAGGLIFAALFSNSDEIGKLTKNTVVQPQNKVTINAKDDYSIPEAVAEKTMASVVGITTKQIRESNDLFFGTTRRVVEGVGSGIVLSGDGYILTNSHVIADGKAQDIKVLFMDGKEIEGTMVWNDILLDLAVVKVEADGLAPAELGDSDKVKIGEPAVAIGNPLGLEFERTVTSGIISGVNRSFAISENYNMEGLIQTDASINNGNSGGPLLNKDGKVIGINTLKIQTVEGMGFAQPVNIAKPVIDQILKTGNFEEAYVGIHGEDALRYQKVTGRDFGVEYGTLITRVEKDSPADKAELKPGDVIISLNGDRVESFQGLKRQLYKFKPGETVIFGIIRDKQSLDKDVELESVLIRQE